MNLPNRKMSDTPDFEGMDGPVALDEYVEVVAALWQRRRFPTVKAATESVSALTGQDDGEGAHCRFLCCWAQTEDMPSSWSLSAPAK